MADTLRTLTEGRFNPVVASFLEEKGYGMKGKYVPIERSLGDIPLWAIRHRSLFIDGPIAFDFGGIGKGYCIDKIVQILKRSGYKYFLVDGGGDMFATTKADGSPFRIAIEYPGKPDMAMGVVDIVHQGLAMSDSFRRRFGKWHHLIDMNSHTLVDKIIGCAGLAPTAFLADCMTSGLFFASQENYTFLEEKFHASYIVFRNDETVLKSDSWSGEMF